MARASLQVLDIGIKAYNKYRFILKPYQERKNNKTIYAQQTENYTW